MPEPIGGPPDDSAAEGQIRRLTRRSLLTGAAVAVAGYAGWRWLGDAAMEDDLPWPLRRMLRFNQALGQRLFSDSRLAPTCPNANVQGPGRTNGLVGLDTNIATAGWKIRVQHAGRAVERALPLSALQKLPRFDLVTELRCVEGWSEVMKFSGVRFLDFVTEFALGTRSGKLPDREQAPQDLYRFVYVASPDEAYYVGLDMASALHPQTILCDAMNDQPLTREHGAPLRLYLPVKYGYKSPKRVGIIRFQDEPPRDYWGERGYDWYGGL